MKLANPAPLGLTGFALTTWMLSMVNAGWFTGAAVPLVLASAFAYGGTAQFAAGLMELPRGNTFGVVAFCSYGAFWWTFALFVQFFATNVPAGFVGWWLVMWGVFTLYMWVGSLPLEPRPAVGAPGVVDHLLPARRSRFVRSSAPAHGRRLCGANHRGAGVLSRGRRDYQRDPRPRSAADRRATAQGRITQAVENRRFDGGRAVPSERSNSRMPA